MSLPSDDDMFAAEYALGTLDSTERPAADARRKSDRSFDAIVKDWELRLAPLAEATLPMAPTAELWPRILARIEQPSVIGQVGGSVIALRRQVRLWRGATGLVTALAAALALWVAKTDWQIVPRSNQTYVALLQPGSAAPAFLVSLDLGRRTMTVVPSAAVETAGKSLELWMIGPDQAKPLSLGLVDGNAVAHPLLPAQDSALISHATYAVTLEPFGGSPSGQPTSKPVYVGHLIGSVP